MDRSRTGRRVKKGFEVEVIGTFNPRASYGHPRGWLPGFAGGGTSLPQHFLDHPHIVAADLPTGGSNILLDLCGSFCPNDG